MFVISVHDLGTPDSVKPIPKDWYYKINLVQLSESFSQTYKGLLKLLCALVNLVSWSQISASNLAHKRLCNAANLAKDEVITRIQRPEGRQRP